ncbi:MAG: hypothetical protein GY797_21780 [Deltaproteobacteria bacterium]|nr:hypothetical protein [Deltaproteobacteria bacterium]
MRNKTVLSSYFTAALILAAIIFCFQSSSYADDITLRWASNTEPDLAGYKIYYKNGYSGTPYDGVDIDQGSSPIFLTIDDPDDPYYVDPDNPEFLLTGLDENEDYFLVITAIDNEEPYNESGFSNEVNTLESSSSSGGSGSGEYSRSASSCFIASSVSISNIDCFKNHFDRLGKTAKYILAPVARQLNPAFFIYPFILTACIIFVLTGLICGAKSTSTKTATSA